MRRPKLRRNDPCWCLSGAKYKSCHAGQTPVGNLILIAGEPGVGKSTLRDELNRRLGSYFFAFDYDDQLKKLVDSKGKIDPETFRWAQQQIILGLAQATDQSAVIADCLFSEHKLEKFKSELVRAGKRPFIVLIRCEELTRQTRIKNRHANNPDAPIGSILNGLTYDQSSSIWDAIFCSDQTPDKLATDVLETLRAHHWKRRLR